MGRPSTLPTVAHARPELVSDWHPDNPKTPEQVSIGAKYRAHWKCRNIITYRGKPRPCGYEWTNTVQNRAQAGQGCPACAGKQAHDWNNLAELHPRLIPEWAPTNTLTAYQVTPGSGYKATWVCRTCTHTWVTTVDKRALQGQGCKQCSTSGGATPANNLLVHGDPALIREWHPKNPKGPDQYRPYATTTVWWKCHNVIQFNGEDQECGYEYERPICVRYQGSGCPACSGHVATFWNNIPYTSPELLIDWHEDNILRPENVTRGQHDIIKWRCHNIVDKFGKHEMCGYVWETQVYNRAAGKGCHACCGHAVTDWNSFAAKHPLYISRWSPGNEKTPYEVTPGTDYPAEWVCDNSVSIAGLTIVCGNTWKTKPYNRVVLGTDCPECMLWSTSKDEIHLAHELALFYTVENTGRRIQGATQKWKTDIVLPDLNIIVEYDGSYWHRDKTERDLRKSIDLTTTGWTVIRAREHPLEPLTPNDILCVTGNHKNTADQVLKQIESLTGQPINGLSDYLLKPDPQNGEAALQRATELRANVLSNREKRRATTSG